MGRAWGRADPPGRRSLRARLRACALAVPVAGAVAGAASLPSIDPDCAYGVLQGDAKGFMPIGHDAYEIIIEARKLKMQ